MKTPPFLVGAALLFWGWQTDFLAVGAMLGVILEASRYLKLRWELADEDFMRIWTLCSVLIIASIAFAFTSHGGADSVRGLFNDPNLAAQRSASNTLARTANAVVRWMPMLFFLFVAGQAYCTREQIPMATISIILQRRWRKAKQLNLPPPPSPGMNVSYPYFGICLVAASVHSAGDTRFFWGLSLLLAWALWAFRSRRWSFAVWASALGTAIVFGYYGQFGIGQLQQLIENSGMRMFSFMGRRSVDPTQSRTKLGQIGEVKLSPRIVIRLKPVGGSPPPQYLREASYRTYRMPSWTTGAARESFENITPGPTETSWQLLPRALSTATNSIACYLDKRTREGNPASLLPLPHGTARLENLPVYVLQKNSLGSVLAEGPGLVIFDAISGPGETIDSPPDTNDLAVLYEPDAIILDGIVDDLGLKDLNAAGTLLAVQDYFQRDFEYSTWQLAGPPPGTNETALTRFLLQTRRGHCEYFATATALLLRRAGIPTRYAVGYVVHETSGGGYVIRERDAHAWCLVWHNGQWENFDTTPSSWIEEENRKRSPLQFVSDAWSRLVFEVSKLRWGQTNFQSYILYALIPVLLFLIYEVFFRRRWRRQRAVAAVPAAPFNWPGLDSEFYQLEKALAVRGFVRNSWEPPGDWLERISAEPTLQDLRPAFEPILRLHYRYRFDPMGIDVNDRTRLKQESDRCISTKPTVTR